MKLSLVLAVSLLSASAFAANDSVKVCNPANKAQYLEVKVADGQMTSTSGDGENKEVQKLKVDKTQVLTIKDLRQIATANDLEVNLESGTAYLISEGAYAIVSDGQGVKYLVQILGPMLQILGNSNSCR